MTILSKDDPRYQEYLERQRQYRRENYRRQKEAKSRQMDSDKSDESDQCEVKQKIDLSKLVVPASQLKPKDKDELS